MRIALLPALALVLSGTALAKLPAPSDEAKAKAAETAAKSAWSAKVAAFETCKAQDAAVLHYHAAMQKAGKAAAPAGAAAPCADPGSYSAPTAAPAAPATKP
jgi:hypothetical protein